MPKLRGNTKFDIASQQVLCEFCDTKYDPYSFDHKTSDAIESQEFKVTVFTCPQCGGEILNRYLRFYRVEKSPSQ